MPTRKSFDDRESQEFVNISEQEIESSAPNASIKKSSPFHEKNRFSQSAGSIHARTIRAQNVVVGTQINYGSSEASWKQTPPLQRPRRAEHFTDRDAERARLLADLKPGRIVTVCGPGSMGKTALIAEILWTLAPGGTPPAVFPDGFLFHSFYSQPKAVVALERIARAYGEEPLPTPADAAQRALSGKRVLLVLDGA